jgi:hypothetical protein
MARLRDSAAITILTLRASTALLLACARFALGLGMDVRAQTRRWQREAASIEDPRLRSLALCKLRQERFNAEAASFAATLCPSPHRRGVARAIMALEVMFDYLDGLTEQPLCDPLAEGMALYEPFVGVFAAPSRQRPDSPADGSGRYLAALAGTVAHTLADLPAGEAICEAAAHRAITGAEAQVRMHAAPALGETQLHAWSRQRFSEGAHGLGWREQLAGAACSVLALHALIVAAADPRTTPADADRLCAAYLPLCALMTLLDGLVDREHDANAGHLGYVGLYEHDPELSQALACAAGACMQASRPLRARSHHTMLLAGGVAYWLSMPGADDDACTAATRDLRAQLGPLLLPSLLLMGCWRALKGTRAVGRRRAVGTPRLAGDGSLDEGSTVLSSG